MTLSLFIVLITLSVAHLVATLFAFSNLPISSNGIVKWLTACGWCPLLTREYVAPGLLVAGRITLAGMLIIGTVFVTIGSRGTT